MKPLLLHNDKKEILDQCIERLGVEEGYVMYFRLMERFGEENIFTTHSY
jgi:hypothetical protein